LDNLLNRFIPDTKKGGNMPVTDNRYCPVCKESFYWPVQSSYPAYCPNCASGLAARNIAIKSETPIGGVKGGFAIGGFDNT
jgi:hypothetical protein